MNRRTLLGRTAAAATATLALAGCLRDGRNDEVLEQTETEFGQDDDGYLTYTVTVSNPSNRDASATLYVNSELEGEAMTRVREISVPAHTTKSYTLTYDVQYDELSESFSPSVDIQED